jgi:hypothetical protein
MQRTIEGDLMLEAVWGKVTDVTNPFRPVVKLAEDAVGSPTINGLYLAGWTPTMNASVLVLIQDDERVAIIATR